MVYQLKGKSRKTSLAGLSESELREHRARYQREYYRAHREQALAYQHDYNLLHKQKHPRVRKSSPSARDQVREVYKLLDLQGLPVEKLEKTLERIRRGERQLVS